jgi:hypothetical protein
MFRLLFKPHTGSLWGFNGAFITLPKPSFIKKGIDDIDHEDEMEEEENEVDLAKTMWIVLRKHRSMNKILK